MRFAGLFGTVALLATMSSPSSAVVAAIPDFQVGARMGNFEINMLDTSLAGEEQFNLVLDSEKNQVFRSTGARSAADLSGNWDFTWDVTIKPDPYILATVSITNLAGVAMPFHFDFDLPIAAITPSTLIGGSVEVEIEETSHLSMVGSTTDQSISALAAFDGIYQAFIDGAAAGTELLAISPAVPLTCGTSSPGCVASTDSLFTIAGLAAIGTASGSGPAALSSIGIDLDFILSPGDTATITAFFEVTPVPLPAAAWFLAAGCAGFAAVGRRKTQA